MPRWNPWDARADADFILATTTYQSGLPNSIPLSALSVPITFNDGIQLGFGDPDAVFEWNTDQTKDALILGLSGSNNFIITTQTRLDAAYDFTFADSATPTLYITSGAAATNQWIRMYQYGWIH